MKRWSGLLLVVGVVVFIFLIGRSVRSLVEHGEGRLAAAERSEIESRKTGPLESDDPDSPAFQEIPKDFVGKIDFARKLAGTDSNLLEQIEQLSDQHVELVKKHSSVLYTSDSSAKEKNGERIPDEQRRALALVESDLDMVLIGLEKQRQQWKAKEEEKTRMQLVAKKYREEMRALPQDMKQFMQKMRQRDFLDTEKTGYRENKQVKE